MQVAKENGVSVLVISTIEADPEVKLYSKMTLLSSFHTLSYNCPSSETLLSIHV